jgi:hypothetical protein
MTRPYFAMGFLLFVIASVLSAGGTACSEPKGSRGILMCDQRLMCPYGGHMCPRYEASIDHENDRVLPGQSELQSLENLGQPLSVPNSSASEKSGDAIDSEKPANENRSLNSTESDEASAGQSGLKFNLKKLIAKIDLGFYQLSRAEFQMRNHAEQLTIRGQQHLIANSVDTYHWASNLTFAKSHIQQRRTLEKSNADEASQFLVGLAQSLNRCGRSLQDMSRQIEDFAAHRVEHQARSVKSGKTAR